MNKLYKNVILKKDLYINLKVLNEITVGLFEPRNIS